MKYEAIMKIKGIMCVFVRERESQRERVREREREKKSARLFVQLWSKYSYQVMISSNF